MRIILTLILYAFFQMSSYGQYDMYDLQFQMNMQIYQQQLNDILNKINKEHSFNCTNGKNLACSFTISRISGGLINPVAVIQNAERTKTKQIDISSNLGTHVSVHSFGKGDWELAYGDRITISTDGNVSISFNIGIDDNMSEIDWNLYKNQLINQSKQKIERYAIENSVKQQINKSVVLHSTIQANRNSNNSNLRLVKKTCTSCSGTGVCSSWSSVAAYGSTQEKWCPNCNKWVSASHGPHLQCIPCQGKGYTESYEY